MKKLLLLLLFVSGAFALDISSPTAKTYTGDISLDISHPQKLNRIIYIVDGIEKGSCTNCSELHSTLSLSNGNHMLLAYGYMGTDFYSDSVDFTIGTDSAHLVIDSPVSKNYDSRTIRLDFTVDKSSNMTYVLDGNTVSACTNCRSFEDDIIVDYGRHTLVVKAKRGSATDTKDVDFTVNGASIGLDVVSPREKEYSGRDIVLDFTTDEKTDITYEIDGRDYDACTNCRSFEKTVRLAEGDHTLKVRAETSYDYESKTIDFSINEDATGINLDVVSPTEKEYASRDVRLYFTTSTKADITYEIDGDDYDACTSCTKFDKTVRLTEGDHTLKVRADAGSDYEKETVDFSINEDATGINLDVISPIEKTYSSRDVKLQFSTDEYADITYVIDSTDYDACTDCKSFTKTVRLSNGDHTIKVRADAGSDYDTATVDFTIDESASGNGLEIVKPEAKDYSSQDISIDIRSDKSQDINYWIDGKKQDSCTSCTRLTDEVTLAYGWHTLLATAGSDSETVKFRVTAGSSGTDYGTDFEKLPQLLEDGDITDAELAKILRENRMPPGIVNRLIKTGKLGDQAIDAILSYQFNPPGIMKKFWGWFGWRQMSYSEEIYDMYSVNETHWEKMLQRGDLPTGKANQVKEKLSKKIKPGKSSPGNSWKGGHK